MTPHGVMPDTVRLVLSGTGRRCGAPTPAMEASLWARTRRGRLRELREIDGIVHAKDGDWSRESDGARRARGRTPRNGEVPRRGLAKPPRRPLVAQLSLLDCRCRARRRRLSRLLPRLVKHGPRTPAEPRQIRQVVAGSYRLAAASTLLRAVEFDYEPQRHH